MWLLVCPLSVYYTNYRGVVCQLIFYPPPNYTHRKRYVLGNPQTNDFSARFSSHEKWNSAAQRGATHIHAVVVPLAANRDVLEKRLIAHLQPPLNEQHRGLRYQLMSV